MDPDDIVDVGETGEYYPDEMLNKANKELKANIGRYREDTENKKKEVEDITLRLKNMTEHAKNVKLEIANTQQLCQAKGREIETEEHLAQLADRQVGRLAQEIKGFGTEMGNLQEKLDQIQNQIFIGNNKMDDLKNTMNYNQDELDQWDLARKQKEDDALALEKYQRADSAKIRELNLQVEKLSRQVLNRKKDLEKEITETQAAQIELDKTAEDFRNLHKERQDLIRQWEESIQAMHKRDEAIKGAGERFAEGKAWQIKRTEQLQDRVAFMNIEIQNNKEMDNKVAQEDRVLSKYRSDHFLISKHLRELDDELEVLKNTLGKAQHDLNAKKTAKTNLLDQLQTKQEGFERLKATATKTTEKLEKEIEQAQDLELHSKLVNDMLTETENTLKELEKEMVQLKDETYQKSKELIGVRRNQANLVAEISGAQAQNKNMLSKIHDLDQETFKQQELLYNIEFQVQQMERKVNRAKGERTEEEKKELKEKINMLQTMLDDLQKQHKVLDLQVKRVIDEVRQSKVVVQQKSNEKGRQNNIILELTLQNESCNTELNKLTKDKESLLVNHDVLKLQVNRIKAVLQQQSEELIGLSNRKSQLEITVEEREHEIQTHKDILKMEKKTVEEERRKVAQELKRRVDEVKHLKNRFSVLINRIQRDDDDAEGEMTHAQYIVKTAKEREELQAQGDKLDLEIKRLEKEAKKLDKTIAMLKSCNSAFKGQFRRATGNDPEVETKTTLQTKAREAQALVNRKTNDMKQYLKNQMNKVSELQDVKRENQELNHKIEILKEGAEGVKQTITEYRNVINRLNTSMGKMRRSLDLDVVNDITLHEQREVVGQVLVALNNFATNQGDVAFTQAFSQLLEEYQMEVPRPSSARSSASSTRSSV
eukprot:TRINITY_DN68136_c1_g1_i25.p1 TRINITY_DN68136_c1_g1~~TRINITY_DN68136_c1_g1_i25.p1  ORF type:complete len:882 (-),score=182.33 TRINITY_DN68136_c1_g1_i25:2396-5041(-)